MKARGAIVPLVALFIVFLGIGYRVVRSSAASEVKTAIVRRGDVTAAISAPGRIVLLNEVKLNFKTEGRLKRLFVDEGDPVAKDQILAELEDSDLMPQLKQAEANLSTVKASWSKLRQGASAEELALAQVAVDNTALALEAVKRKLAEAEASTARDLSAAQTALDNAKATRDWTLAEREEALKDWQDKVTKYEHPVLHIPNYTAAQEAEVNTAKDKADAAYATFLTAEEAYKAAQESYQVAALKAKSALNIAQDQVDAASGQYQTALAQLNLKKAPLRSQDVKVAKNQIKVAQASLEQIRNKMDDTILRAPFDATIISISAKEGEFVSGGGPGLSQLGGSLPFVLLAESGRVHMVADVDESDIGKVKLGQPSEITLDAFPERVIKGKVSDIAVGPSPSSEGAVVFPVKIDVLSRSSLLKGMAGEARIVTESRKSAIIIPASAVVEKGGKHIVFVMEGSVARTRQVKLGLSSDNHYEVKDGLKDGERIVIEGASKLTDGMRVRIR